MLGRKHKYTRFGRDIVPLVIANHRQLAVAVSEIRTSYLEFPPLPSFANSDHHHLECCRPAKHRKRADLMPVGYPYRCVVLWFEEGVGQGHPHTKTEYFLHCLDRRQKP